jgi:hypothetical protein
LKDEKTKRTLLMLLLMVIVVVVAAAEQHFFLEGVYVAERKKKPRDANDMQGGCCRVGH